MPVYPRFDLTSSGSVTAPGARPAEPTTVRKPLPHSAGSLTRLKRTLTWMTLSFWSETFFSLNEMAGTSLFCPLMMPASNQPVETS